MKSSLWAIASVLALAAPSAAQTNEDLAIRPFALATVQAFTAADTFDAVFGRIYQPFLGGGVQVIVDGTYVVELTASRFTQTGERAFISNGQKFRLGIPLTATVTPLEATAGYRFKYSPRVRPYAAAGAGIYLYKETSDFSESAEDVDSRHVGFVANGGAEFRVSRWVGICVDAQYTRVPGILGRSGVSQQAGDNDLGGIAGRVRVVVGR